MEDLTPDEKRRIENSEISLDYELRNIISTIGESDLPQDKKTAALLGVYIDKLRKTIHALELQSEPPQNILDAIKYDLEITRKSLRRL